jgi:broad specificity phosphatase PhoE
MRLVYFITHPDVVIDPKVPVPQWPLSRRGRERMKRLMARPWVKSTSSVYCSTEQKAIDGAAILAGHLSIGYKMVEELGEIDRSATGYLPEEEHAATAEMFFAHPESSIRGWETARDAQRRIVKTVEGIIEGDTGRGNIAIVSHGGVGTLHLCHVKGRPISWRERQPGGSGGNYYCFEAQSKILVHGWKPIDGCCSHRWAACSAKRSRQ